MADIRAYQPSFTAGELSPALGARVDLAKYGSGLRTAINLFIHPHGGASNRAGTEFISEVKNSAHIARKIPFEFSTDQTYRLEFGHLHFRVIRDGGHILSGGGGIYEVATPYAHTDIDAIVYLQDGDIMYLCHPDYPVHKISRLADDNWTITQVTFAPTIVAPIAPTIVKPGDTSSETGYKPTTYSYKVSAVSADTGEESLPSPPVSVVNDLSIKGGTNRVLWATVARADRYIVYREDGGVYGYIGGTSGLSFDDKNITPDLADTPQMARNPFDGPGKYPRCATFIEQRLGFASTKNDPRLVCLSQSVNYENFGYSQPSKASDAVTFRVKSRQVNEIRSMIALKGLMLLTSGAEWVVSGGSQSDAIAPSAIKIDNHGYRGSSRVQPIVVGNTVLFSQGVGDVVRDFSYDFATDRYDGRDLTILARHLFEGKSIKAWAYAQSPHSIAWVVLDDGSLVSLTYMREHDVWAWTRHESGPNNNAVFEDVTVAREGREDVPYFVVRRTIGGTPKRYIERLHSRFFATIEDAFFVDCGLTYTGAPTTRIIGLDHLNSETVVALADGNVVRNLTVGPVTGGIGITLPNAASKVHVGLPMIAALETLDLDLGQVNGLGTVQGRQKSVSGVTLRVEKTRGIFVGPHDGGRESKGLVEYKQRQGEAWGEAIQPYTGDVAITPQWDWNTHGSMWIKQFDPLPMTILAIMPDVTVGR